MVEKSERLSSSQFLLVTFVLAAGSGGARHKMAVRGGGGAVKQNLNANEYKYHKKLVNFGFDGGAGV
jgi:hypothetical protein